MNLQPAYDIWASTGSDQAEGVKVELTVETNTDEKKEVGDTCISGSSAADNINSEVSIKIPEVTEFIDGVPIPETGACDSNWWRR